MNENAVNGNKNKQQGLLKTAWMIAVIIIFSKLIGFLRDVVIANYYGAGMVSDAYFYAYQIPSLALILLGGVGGPFHSAVVSVFSKMLPDNMKADERLNKLFNTFFTGVFLVFLALAVFCFVFSDVIMKLIISGGSEQLVHLASVHLKILSPVILIGGLVGIYYGALVTFKEFVSPNISPILMSLAIIIIISVVKNDNMGIALAVATTVGACIQLIVQYPNIRKVGFRIKPNFDFKNNEKLKNIMELLFPAILSSTVGQIYIYIDMFFTSHLDEGAWTAIGYANRIFQFPVGILVTAFLVPLFPIFSQLVEKRDFENIKIYFDKGVGVLNLFAFPIFMAILLLGYDAVTFVFQRGAFDSNATLMVTQALLFLSLAILPYIFRDTVTRIYYAFNDSKTPFLVALSSVLLKLIINALLIDKLNIGAITLSTSFVTLFNGAVLGFLLRKKIRLYYDRYFRQLLKMFLSALVAGVISGIIYLVWFVDRSNTLLLFIKLIVMLFVIFGLYLAAGMHYKVEYILILYERLRNKINGYIRR